MTTRMYKFTPERNWYRNRQESSSESETDSDSSDDDIQVITSRVYPSKKERMKHKSKQSSGQMQPAPPGYVNFPVPVELLNQTQPVTYTVTISPANAKYPTEAPSQPQQPFYQPPKSMPSYIPIYVQADRSGFPQFPQQAFTTAPAMGMPIQPDLMTSPNVPMTDLVYVPGYVQPMQYFY